MRTPLLSQFLIHLPQYHSSVSLSTLWLYSNACRHFISIVGDKRMASYSPLDVERFKHERSKFIKPNTVNIELRSVRTIFNRARKLKVIRENPFSEVSLVRVPKSVPAYLTLEESRKLIEAVKLPMLKVFYLFLSQTGARIGEAIGLEWKCVDMERKVVSITHSKTGATRVIPISDILFSSLQSLPHRSVYVFTKEDGTPYHKNFVQHHFKRVVKSMGLDGRLHPHSLRHSFASNLVKKNVSLFTVSQLLGHSSIQTSMIYAHLQTSELHEVVNKLA